MIRHIDSDPFSDPRPFNMDWMATQSSEEKFKKICPRVIILTPEGMDAYRNECTIDSMERGESPLIFLLTESTSRERRSAWISVANIIAVYYSYGITPMMRDDVNNARTAGQQIEFRVPFKKSIN